MLLVTFHGGPKPGIDNVFAYDTTTRTLLTSTALPVPPKSSLSELRAMVVSNGHLYVANGAKSISTVLCYAMPASGSDFSFVSTVIGPTLSKQGHFETAIAHPFGIAFNGEETCYVSNQDTNVVAQVNLSPKGKTGGLGKGCQSTYLTRLFPSPAVFLDGTYVASQNGSLHDVEVTATNVPLTNGGMGVTFDSSGKVQNSVRGVAVANGILFVCDEPDSLVNLYSLADGTFLGSSNILSDKPTHLEIQNGGLYVSAGSLLYWGQLPTTVNGALNGSALSLSAIAVTPPHKNKIGGISFNCAAATVYVAFQEGTGDNATGGSIVTYTVGQESPSTLPVFSNGTEFAASGKATFSDTPEFVLYLPD